MKINKIPFSFSLILSSYFLLISCGSQDDTAPTENVDDEPIAPMLISTDISVTSSESLILWTDGDDLISKLESALSYNYGQASESETSRSLSINNDSTIASATIVFKEEFLDVYVDSNTSNNAITIELKKETQEEDDEETQEAAAVVLSANGTGDTYELITSVLGPDNNPIEVPDCGHAEFGRHIDELFDDELNTNVFRFYLHTAFDDDRCLNADRQRNEIKTYSKPPDNLKGIEGETVVYKWKFKLQEGFQSSTSFTHLHQIKAVGETVASTPMYTLTTRKSTPDRLELRYAEDDDQITLKRTDLAPLINTWLEVTETIRYGIDGTYDIVIKKVSDATVLFEYTNNTIRNWQPGTEFVRPKWGIYRSLNSAEDLRDENVLYNDFSIQEITE